MNVNVTCCTVAYSAGAVLAEVTVMFTFVPSQRGGEGRGGQGGLPLCEKDVTER